MGQILTLNNIISIIEIKSSPDMKIYPVDNYLYYCDNLDENTTISYQYSNTYNPDRIFDDPEYMTDYILNVDLVEEPIITNYIEDSYGIILNVV